MLIYETFPGLEALLAKRDTKKAEVVIAKHLRSGKDPEAQAMGLIARAHVRLIAGRLDDGLTDLNAAKELDPLRCLSAEYLELVGDCHFGRFELAHVGFADRSDTAQAMIAYEQILRDFPDYENTGWILYQQGRVMLTENRSEEAVALFQQALLSPSAVPALTSYCYERLGFIYCYELRDLPRAISFLNKAVDTYPESEPRAWLVGVHTLRSRVLREMHNFSAALTAADAALALATNTNTSKLSLADAYLVAAEIAAQLNGKERDVISYLQAFLQYSKKPLGIDVTWSRVHEMLGDAYWRTSQPQLALNAYQAVLEHNPYHPWELSLYYRIGRCYYQLSEYGKAIQALEKMLDIAAKDNQTISDYRVYQLLANSYFAAGRYELSETTYKAALKIAPQDTDHVADMVRYMQLAQQHVQSA
jgi:tetratricopeptide (TPR) repeat protein